ncbi:MAG: chemotaxis protein CheW [Halobacteria archaeon]|nr:chemotaxis protein CheW [Halobacteria archaeon]
MSTQAQSQVLEFDLGSKKYCVDITEVSEIIDKGSLTPIPNSAPHVEGVMDLRGQTTKIINPKKVLGIEGGDEKRIIVFDGSGSESGTDETQTDLSGWLVDEVHEVIKVSEDDLDESVGDDNVKGVIRDDGDFVIWIEPSGIN